VYEAHEPFDPEKLYAFFGQECPGIIRTKGFFWLASRPDFFGEVSQAGALVRHQGIGRWWSAVPKERWPEDLVFIQSVKRDWHAEYGDRKQKIFFIGLSSEMDEALIPQQLDICLVRDYLTDPESYLDCKDPFPIWFAES